MSDTYALSEGVLTSLLAGSDNLSMSTYKRHRFHPSIISYAAVSNLFNLGRHLIPASHYRLTRTAGLVTCLKLLARLNVPISLNRTPISRITLCAIFAFHWRI